MLLGVLQSLLDELGDLLGVAGLDVQLVHHGDDPHFGFSSCGHGQFESLRHILSLSLRQVLAAADVRRCSLLKVIWREYLVRFHLDRVIINNYNLNKKAIRMMEAQDASISEEEESDRWRPNQQHNDGSK
jgi:hypothetical protein